MDEASHANSCRSVRCSPTVPQLVTAEVDSKWTATQCALEQTETCVPYPCPLMLHTTATAIETLLLACLTPGPVAVGPYRAAFCPSSSCRGPSRMLKSSLASMSTEVSVRAVTVAARGSPLSRASSPKYMVGPSRITSCSHSTTGWSGEDGEGGGGGGVWERGGGKGGELLVIF